MSNIYGEHIKMTIFGQSHSKAIGMTLEGIPAGEPIDLKALQKFLDRRAPGRNEFSTARKEADQPEFLCGLVENVTCGTPITAIIRNNDTRSKDYSNLKYIPRPGHADYTAEVKYHGHQDYAGGGHFSGRLTAPLCIAGGICKQLLEQQGVRILTRIVSIADVKDDSKMVVLANEADADATAKRAGVSLDKIVKTVCAVVPDVSEKPFPVIDDAAGQKMQETILSAKAEGDSVGGVVECAVLGLAPGIGDHIFGGLENRIASAIFGIPAVKGLEFGDGFDVAGLKGSQNNDAFCIKDGKVATATNHCGGILGGITNGMPVQFKVAFKPTPSIYKKQQSVDLRTMEETELQIEGRHDPCIVLRALPCVEAAAALAVYDAMLSGR